MRVVALSNPMRGLFLPLAIPPRPLCRLALGSVTHHAPRITLDRHAVTLASVTLSKLPP
jgi:hypothetical protein